jgi:hypothetical protein
MRNASLAQEPPIKLKGTESMLLRGQLGDCWIIHRTIVNEFLVIDYAVRGLHFLCFYYSRNSLSPHRRRKSVGTPLGTNTAFLFLFKPQSRSVSPAPRTIRLLPAKPTTSSGVDNEGKTDDDRKPKTNVSQHSSQFEAACALIGQRNLLQLQQWRRGDPSLAGTVLVVIRVRPFEHLLILG